MDVALESRSAAIVGALGYDLHPTKEATMGRMGVNNERCRNPRIAVLSSR